MCWPSKRPRPRRLSVAAPRGRAAKGAGPGGSEPRDRDTHRGEEIEQRRRLQAMT